MGWSTCASWSAGNLTADSRLMFHSATSLIMLQCLASGQHHSRFWREFLFLYCLCFFCKNRLIQKFIWCKNRILQRVKGILAFLNDKTKSDVSCPGPPAHDSGFMQHLL